MALVRPFKARRPVPGKAEDIVCVPYDVITTEEAVSMAEGNPDSFLHVIRPETDLPAGTDIHSDEVYEQGRKNLEKFLTSDLFVEEEEPALYMYRLVWKGRSQTGIFGCLSTEEYNTNIILKHELTRPDKEDDRTRHILTQQAHAEPVMITYDDTRGIAAMMQEEEKEEPLYDFMTEDEVQHTIWKVSDAGRFQDAFGQAPRLYIADGHHRCASAARVAAERAAQNPEHTGEEEYNFFPAVLFPLQQMEILAYNRIIYSLPEDFIDKLSEAFELKPASFPVPLRKGTVCMYTGEEWYLLKLPESRNNDAASSLDVSRLQEFILEPYLGISNQRTDKNIDFVGGIRGTHELEKLVDTGEAALAFSMYPTDIEELAAVSDAGLLMPPKSTWFEPKLRSGFLIHTF